MAFKKTLAQRLLNLTKTSGNHHIFPSSSSSLRSRILKKFDIALDPKDARMFCHFLHKRLVFLPELCPPPTTFSRGSVRWTLLGLEFSWTGGVTVQDVKKVLRAVQIETVKSKLRRIPQSCTTCLSDATKKLPGCCEGKKGGRVLLLSCDVILRWFVSLGPPTQVKNFRFVVLDFEEIMLSLVKKSVRIVVRVPHRLDC